MNLRKAKFILLIGFISINLVGCITFKGDLPLDYQLGANRNEGVVAASFACNVGKNVTQMHFRQNHTASGQKANKSDVYSVTFNCNAPDEELSTPELKLINLPEGEYAFYYWRQIFYGGSRQALGFTPINFYVYPNRVVYIGRIELVVGYNQRYKTAIEFKLRDDLPLIKQRLPLVSIKDIKVEKPWFSNFTINFNRIP